MLVCYPSIKLLVVGCRLQPRAVSVPLNPILSEFLFLRYFVDCVRDRFVCRQALALMSLCISQLTEVHIWTGSTPGTVIVKEAFHPDSHYNFFKMDLWISDFPVMGLSTLWHFPSCSSGEIFRNTAPSFLSAQSHVLYHLLMLGMLFTGNH